MDLMFIGRKADITYELLNSAFPLRMPSLWGRGTGDDTTLPRLAQRLDYQFGPSACIRIRSQRQDFSYWVDVCPCTLHDNGLRGTAQ